MRLSSVEAAASDLKCAGSPWFRGHVSQHRLLPALFRFGGRADQERILIERFRSAQGLAPDAADSDLETLVAMHHRYVPTRLLEWTRSLNVAVFCALVREHSQPALFVLNPTALNQLSGISGTTDAATWNDEAREYPLAVELRGTSAPAENLFTWHGTNTSPLEDQCPSCMRRVILTDDESASGKDDILSDEWARVIRLAMRHEDHESGG